MKQVVLLAGALAAAVAWGYPSAVTYVTDDQTVEFAASTADSSKVTDTGTANKYGSYVYAKLSDTGSGTLKVTVPSGAKTAIMWSALFVTNGVLTLDLTDVAKAGIPYSQRGGIITRYPDATGKICEGKLVVKGTNTLVCGDPKNSYERFEIGENGIAFQDADGQTLADGKIVFTANFCFLNAPEGKWEFDDGNVKTASLGKSRGFDGLITEENGKKVLDFPYSLTLMGLDMVDPEATIRLAANKTLNAYYSHFGTKISEETNTTQAGSEGFFWSLNGEGNKEQVIANDIEMPFESSVLQAGLRVVTFEGKISGKGRVYISTARNNDYCRTWFEDTVNVGKLTFNAGASVHATKPFDLRFFGETTIPTFDFSTTNVVSTFEASADLAAVTGFDGELPAAAEWKYPAICAKGKGTVVKVGSVEGFLRFLTEDGGKIEFKGFTFQSSDSNGALLCDGEYVRTPHDFKVVVSEGHEVDVSAMRAVPMEVNGKAKIGFLPWAEPTLWLDASAAGTVSNLWLDAAVDGTGDPSKKTYKDAPGYIDDDHLPFRPTVEGADQNTYYYVERWNDWREGQSKWYAYNNRHRGSDRGWWPEVYPIAVPNGLNGRTYVAMDALTGQTRSRRFELSKRSNAYIAPQFAILVYCSQAGGGNAILANSGLGRGGPADKIPTDAQEALAWPVTTNEYFKAGKVWLDGTEVDATEAKLSGGWQIISIQLDGKFSIAGLGFMKNSSKDGGGMSYAEVMFFDSVPTEAQRVDAEFHLACKWGLEGSYKGHAAADPITAYGTGEIELDGVAACAGGAYAGKVTLKNGACLDLSEIKLVPKASDIEAIEGRAAWFDPDDEESVQYSTTKNYEQCVRALFDRTSEGEYVLSASDSRAPSVEARTAGYGVTRKWLQFANVNPTRTGANYGRALRMNAYSQKPHTYAQDVTSITNTKTVFLVMDSSQGGGCPFLDKSISGQHLIRFTKTTTAFSKDWTIPIWPSGAVSSFFGSAAGGETYLNGQPVDGATEGFTGGPEVLTAIAGNADGFALAAFGGYSYKNEPTVEKPYSDVGEIEGEALVFTKKVGTEERQKIEAYLMHKWMGMLPVGSPYASVEKLTVSGEGAVRVKTAAALPAFDDFTGHVTVSEQGAFTAAIAAGGVVTPAFDVNATMALPAQCTLSVSVEGKSPRVWYTVARAAGGLDKTTWALTAPENYRMKVTATEIKVRALGGLIIIAR